MSEPVLGAAAQIRAVYTRSQNPRNFEKVYYFVFKFLDLQHQIYIVLRLLYFCLFENSANKTKAFNLKVNFKELRFSFVRIH